MKLNNFSEGFVLGLLSIDRLLMSSARGLMRAAHFFGISQSLVIWCYAWFSNLLFLTACALNEPESWITLNGIMGFVLFVGCTKLFFVHASYQVGREVIERIDAVDSPNWRLFVLLSWALCVVPAEQYPAFSCASRVISRGYLIYLIANYDTGSGIKAKDLIQRWLKDLKRKFSGSPTPALQPSSCAASK